MDMNILNLIQAKSSSSAKEGLSQDVIPNSTSFNDIVKSEQHQSISLNISVDNDENIVNNKTLNEAIANINIIPGQPPQGIIELLADNQHTEIPTIISDLTQSDIANINIANIISEPIEIKDQLLSNPINLDRDPLLASMAGGNYVMTMADSNNVIPMADSNNVMPTISDVVMPQSINFKHRFEHKIDQSQQINNTANDNSLISNLSKFVVPIQENQIPAENSPKVKTEFKQEMINIAPLDEIEITNLLNPASVQNGKRENITDENTVLPAEEAVLPPEITSQPKYYSKNEESGTNKGSSNFDKAPEIYIDAEQKPKYQEEMQSKTDDNQAGALAVNNNAKILLPNQGIKIYEAQNNIISTNYDEVQVSVSHSIKDGNKINVQLHPAELGKIDIYFELSDKGNHISIIADKAHTLDMLQKDARNLEKILNDVGLGADASSLSFSLSHGNSDKNNNGNSNKLAKFFNQDQTLIEETNFFIKYDDLLTSRLDLSV